MNKLMQILPALLLPFGLIAQTGATLNFDGFDDEVTLSHFARPSEMTIEAWINTSTIVDAQIVGWAGNTNNSAEFKVSGGQVFYFEWDNSNWVGVGSVMAVNDGQWHHVAVTRSSATNFNVTIFVDGAMVNSGTANVPISTNALNIGAYNYSGLQQFFEGSIDEVRIWNRVLCEGEIQYHANCELVGNETGLLRYYRFNQGVASGSNLSVTQLIDGSSNLSNGVLHGFQLSGTSSNWLAPSGLASGSACPPFSNGLAVNSPTVCRGSSVTLNVTGTAYGYTWSPSGLTSSSIVVSPSVTIVYTVNADVGAGCTSFLTSTVVPSGPTIQVNGPAKVCSGDMITLTASGATSYSWDTGASGLSFTIAINGSTNYIVTGTQNGCSASKSFSVETEPCVGLTQNSPEINSTGFYPNPTSGIINISNSESQELEIFDMTGHLIRRVVVAKETGEIDFRSLPAGLYLLKFSDGRFTKVLKTDG